MALRIPSPKALTKPEAYLAYKAGIMSRDELKQSVYNPLNNYEGWLAKWCGLLETYPTNKDGTPQCLTDEEGLLAYLCGVTNRYPATNSRPDDARISAYIRYLVSARYTRPDHPLNREEFYLSLIKTQFIPSGDPSSDIVIDGTTKAPFVDVKVYGDTFQQSYTGKNLCSPVTEGFFINNAANRVGKTDNDYGVAIPVKNNTSYTISSISDQIRYRVALCDTLPTSTVTVSAYSGINADNTQRTITINSSTHSYLVVNALELSAIQVEEGSTATSYEPYVGGGIPSPNPSYPQPIQTVTGEQTITINGTNYPISLGSIKLCNLDDTYVDYIWEDGDEWKLHKDVGEYTFTDVSGFIWGTDRNRLYIGPTVLAELGINFVPPASQTSEFYALSEKFKAEAFDTGYAASYTGACFICSSGRTWSFRGGWSNETAARTALVGTTVNYALATPTDTVITDQNLIDQLNALKQGGAEDGTTYIKVSATDPNLPAKLYVEAPKYD